MTFETDFRRHAPSLTISFGSSVGDPVAPAVRVTAVVLESEDPKMIGKNPVVNGVWKARHEEAPDICLVRRKGQAVPIDI